MSPNAASLLRQMALKKTELDRLRPLAGAVLERLDRYYDIELTHTSTALEGNTLSAVETTLVIEQGITIGGKSLRDHLEVVDHVDAIGYVRELARHSTPITESDIRNLHSLMVRRSAPEIAGRYAGLLRYVRTESGRRTFPPPVQIPSLIGDFAAWLRVSPEHPETALAAHRRLVDIHPFSDGNGRTARLLMNLILIRARYPPVVIRVEDRLTYTRALQRAQAGQGTEDLELLLCERLDAALTDYLQVLGAGG